MNRQHLLAILGSLIALAMVAGVTLALVGDDDQAAGGTRLETAVALAPPDARRVLFTDWAAVRAELGVTGLNAESPVSDVEDLLDRGFDADLTSASALLSSAGAMQESYGVSPATLEWELFTQSESAASIAMRLGGGVSTDDVAARLRELGYVAPAAPEGTWAGDFSRLPISVEVTPELAFLTLDEATGTIYASDTRAGASRALADARDDIAGPLPQPVVSAVSDGVSAVMLTGAEACGSLAMAGADAQAQTDADLLIEEAGRIDPLTGFAIALRENGSLRVAMSFEDDERARANAESRAVLAAGPATGQGGDFGDRFTLDQVSADGTVVTLDTTPAPDAYAVSDLSSGPVLFATC